MMNTVKLTFSVACAMAMVVGAVAVAQDQQRQQGTRVQIGNGAIDVNVGRNTSDREMLNRRGLPGNVALRASKVIGMNVRNAANESIGEVNDIVLDPATGKVRYAALSFGGFLGVGDKMFAIPWQSFECKKDAEDETYYLVLNVEKSTLENAQGFDEETWPNFADRQITDRIDSHYNVHVDGETTGRVRTPQPRIVE